MKFFQKRWVAITLCVLMIVAAIGIGQAKANRNSAQPGGSAAAEKWGKENYSAYTKFLRDDAGLLSAKAEETICAYNGALDYSYGSLCGVATVSGLSGWDIEDAAYDLFEDMGMGDADCLILVDAETQEWFFVYGDNFSYYVNNELELLFRQELGSAVTNPDRQLPALFEELSGWYAETYPESVQAANGGRIGLMAGGVIFFVFLVVFLIIAAIVSAIIRASRRAVGGFRQRGPAYFYGPGPGPGPRPPYGPGPGPRPPHGPGPGPGPRPNPGPGPRPNPGPRPSSGRPSGGFGGSSRGGNRPSGGFGSGKR